MAKRVRAVSRGYKGKEVATPDQHGDDRCERFVECEMGSWRASLRLLPSSCGMHLGAYSASLPTCHGA